MRMLLVMSKILDAIREAIEKGDTSRYRIWKDLGLSESHLSKLMRGERGLSIEAAERLAEYLNLEITIRPKMRKKE
jgi:transcriptional regulator with XRE-family HTH domain